MVEGVHSVVCGVASAAEAKANVGLYQTPIPVRLWRSLCEEGLLPGDLALRQPSTGLDVLSMDDDDPSVRGRL
jgi:hypothetical protein